MDWFCINFISGYFCNYFVILWGCYMSRSIHVTCFDGTYVDVVEDVIGHVKKRHSEVFSSLGLDEEGLFILLCDVLKKPSEVYADSFGSKYFLRQYLENLYLCIIVDEGAVRTSYLINQKTYSRMRRRRWLRRLC